VIIVIVLICYIALAALANTYILVLSFINALYFTVVSIETIGFGDVTPKTTAARVWTCIFAIVGIVNLGVAVGMTRETVLEGLEVGYRMRARRIRERRRQAARRRRALSRWREGVEWRLRAMGVPAWVRGEGHRGLSGLVRRLERHVERFLGIERGWYGDDETLQHYPRRMKLNLEALSTAQLEAAAMEAGVPLAELLPPDFKMRNSHQRTSWSSSRQGERNQGDGTNGERDRANGECGGENEAGGGVGDGAGRTGPISDALTLTHARLGRMVAMLGRFALAVNGNGAPEHGVSLLPRVDLDRANFLREEQDDDAASVVAPTPECLEGKTSLSDGYESFKHSVKREEKKAFYARFLVAWSLFLVFWLVCSLLSDPSPCT
jgi:potassium channel subfamily K